MDRNYDEIISEMLRQIDRHAEQLEAQIKKSDDQWRDQHVTNAKLHSQLDELEQRIKGHQEVTNQNLELILHTAGILDRIIKKNALQL